MSHFDYIVIGAGSAGCVLANRLTENAATSVLLLEAGGRDLNPFIHIPAGFFKTLHDPSVNWCYATEKQESSGNRAIHWPRGKVLGGSSAINGHLIVRGQPEDYDGWAQLGNRGWSFDEVLPYFKKFENREGGDPEIRGRGGPINVIDPIEQHPLTRLFIEACVEAGVPRNEDYNGREQEGVGYFQHAIRNGRREEHGAHLPARGARPAQSAHRDAGDGAPSGGGGRPCGRRRLPAGRRGARGAGGARGRALGRLHRLAAAAGAFRHRRRRTAQAARYRAGAPSAGRRREPAGTTMSPASA